MFCIRLVYNCDDQPCLDFNIDTLGTHYFRGEDWRVHSAPRWFLALSVRNFTRPLFPYRCLGYFRQLEETKTNAPEQSRDSFGNLKNNLENQDFFAPRCLPNQLLECTPIFSPLIFFFWLTSSLLLALSIINFEYRLDALSWEMSTGVLDLCWWRSKVWVTRDSRVSLRERKTSGVLVFLFASLQSFKAASNLSSWKWVSRCSELEKLTFSSGQSLLYAGQARLNLPMISKNFQFCVFSARFSVYIACPSK